MAIAIFQDTFRNPSCIAAKDIFLLKFLRRKSLYVGFNQLQNLGNGISHISGPGVAIYVFLEAPRPGYF